MSVGICQLRDGVVWNAEDCRRAEAENERLRSRLEEAEALLRKVEWSGAFDGCPVCVQNEPHLPTCALAAWLAASGPKEIK